MGICVSFQHITFHIENLLVMDFQSTTNNCFCYLEDYDSWDVRWKNGEARKLKYLKMIFLKRTLRGYNI